MAADAYVVVGRDPGTIPPDPVLAVGPFTSYTDAEEFRDLLASTTSGSHTVVPLYTPDAQLAQP